ncbi:Cadherin-13 [Myotis davidii]|uniref:Cadherin-13 n=1 Tax=Myotis davidii TaxID=225400 RepID=L5LZC5_MYODS|nr:Cadherin-13 [Myotis davidii]
MTKCSLQDHPPFSHPRFLSSEMVQGSREGQLGDDNQLLAPDELKLEIQIQENWNAWVLEKELSLALDQLCFERQLFLENALQLFSAPLPTLCEMGYQCLFKMIKLTRKHERPLVVDSDRPEGSKFRLTGKGVDQEPKGIFRINENTGSVSVTRTLDREAIATYQLFVETIDVNGRTLEGPVPLEVIVIDQNDNRPSFREGPYVGHVMEGSPTGTTVMRMTAFDADDPATDNALLRYNIRQQTPDKPSPNMFYIDPEKGDIVTVVSPALLDREASIAQQLPSSEWTEK